MFSGILAAHLAAVASVGVGAAVLASPMGTTGSVPGAQVMIEEKIDSGLAPTSESFVSAWLPYWTAETGLTSFTDNAELYTDLTTFYHALRGDAVLVDLVPADVREKAIARAHEEGTVALAAVFDETSPGKMAAKLSTHNKRVKHVEDLMVLVDEQGYDGIDIDYENFAFADSRDSWPKTRKSWVEFIKLLSKELHSRGKLLTVAVPAQYDGEMTDASGFWVYDWEGIQPYVDTLRVMTYDYVVNQAGPISPIDWVRQVTDYGLSVFGPEHFRVGVPTYGRDWIVSTSGDCAGAPLYYNVSRTAEQMIAKAKEYDRPITWNKDFQEGTFQYTQKEGSCRAKHKAHFSDARSVAAKADYALSQGTGIALWSLGGEDPDTWDELRKVSQRYSQADDEAGQPEGEGQGGDAGEGGQ